MAQRVYPVSFDGPDPSGFEGILNSLPGMAYRCGNDAHWTMAWVSDGVRELTGYEAADLVGSRTCSYGSLIHPEDADVVAEEVDRAAAARTPFRLYYRIRRRDGQFRWVWEQGRVLQSADGSMAWVEGYIADVTPLFEARRERDNLAGRELAARAEATAARAHFRALFEAAPGRFLVMAAQDLSIVAVSNAYLEATGTRREDLVGRGLFDAFPDDPAEPGADGTRNLRASLERVLAFRAQDVMAIQRYPIPDGNGGFEERFWSPVNAPVIGDDGQVHYIIHRVEDVTDFMRAHVDSAAGVDRVLDDLAGKEAELYRQSGELASLNESLRASEAMFRRVFDEAPVGISVVHPDGNLALANASFRHMIGVTESSVRGQPLAQWLHPDGREDVAGRDAAVASGELHGHEGEERYLAPDGRETWARVAVTALRDPAGEVTSLLRVAQDISEQKRLAEQLRRRNSLARIAGRLALVGGWALDVASGDFEWSPEVHKIVGWPEGRPLPSVDGVWALHPRQWQAPLREGLERCVAEARPYRLDAEVVTPAGEKKWVTVAAEPEVDASGRVLRVVGILQDITARRREQDELGQVATSLRATLDSMSDAFYLLDHDWRFVFVNAQAELQLNRPATELIGCRLWDEFPETLVAPEFEAYRQAMHDGQARSFEVWYGPLHNWFEISVYPSPRGLAVYFRTVTERKQLTAELTASEERFRYVAEATADAVWDWDLRSDAIWWSSGIQSLFGYAPEDVEPDSRSWTSRIHPGELDRVVEGIHAVIDKGGVQWRDEYSFRCRDGRYARVVDRGFVIRDAEGRPVRMVGGMMDITERMTLEEQLRQSQRLESVGQLTGGMAHDFNNLLTVILGNAEVLSDALEHDPGLRGLAQMVAQAAERGAELTQRMLAFARKQSLEPQPVDANAMLAGMDALLRRTLGEHIEIEMACDPGLWTALADLAQLESAVLNLCLNARDAMPRGGRLVIKTDNARLQDAYVAQNPDVQAGDYVVVSVSDTGTGIAPETIGRVFEPFFTTKEIGKGTGLGLSMVYGYVKQSGGHVALESEPGRGTHVRLYLPRHDGEAVRVLPRDETVEGGSGIILLVEDDALVRSFAQTRLESLGYRVLAAANGHEALAVLHAGEPVDLLFTDVVMPGGMNGSQLAAAAAALRPSLPVLFASGYAEDAMDRHGRLDAGVQLLRKPYRQAELARRVKQAMAGVDGKQT